MQRNICGPHENYLRLDFLPNLLGRSVAKPSHFDSDVFTAGLRTQDFLGLLDANLLVLLGIDETCKLFDHLLLLGAIVVDLTTEI